MGMDDVLLGTLKYGVTLYIKPDNDPKYITFIFTHPKADMGHVTLYTKKSIQEQGLDKLYEKLEVSLMRFVRDWKLESSEVDK